MIVCGFVCGINDLWFPSVWVLVVCLFSGLFASLSGDLMMLDFQVYSFLFVCGFRYLLFPSV